MLTLHDKLLHALTFDQHIAFGDARKLVNWDSLCEAERRIKDVADLRAFEEGMHIWRTDDPSKFLIRVAQHLSRDYPNPMQVIQSMQR